MTAADQNDDIPRKGAVGSLLKGIRARATTAADGSDLTLEERHARHVKMAEAASQASALLTPDTADAVKAAEEAAESTASILEKQIDTSEGSDTQEPEPGETAVPQNATNSAEGSNPDDGKSMNTPDGEPADDSTIQLVGAVDEVPLDELKDEIDSFIGMAPFKEWISDLEEGKGFGELVDFFNIAEMQEAENVDPETGETKSKKKKNSTFYHMVLTGNPGTGKSMTAEAYCQYLRSAEIMPNAMFYKISAGDIVSKYVGATANDLKKVLRKGKDTGQPLILHLDEAYSLTSNKHGEEALTELVNAMTEESDRIVLVLSGYYEPMMEMLYKNEGMRSRVRIELNCPDYEDVELLEIMKLKLPGQSITRELTAEAEAEAIKYFGIMKEIMGENFGNGRVAEVLLQDMELAQQRRITTKYKDLSESEKLARRDEIIADMTTYDVEDIQNAASYRNAMARVAEAEAIVSQALKKGLSASDTGSAGGVSVTSDASSEPANENGDETGPSVSVPYAQAASGLSAGEHSANTSPQTVMAAASDRPTGRPPAV